MEEDQQYGEIPLPVDDVRKELRKKFGNHLTDGEIETIAALYQQAYEISQFFGLANERAVGLMRNVLKPLLTLIWHGEPKCTCLHGRYSTSRRLYTVNKREHAA